MSREAGLSLGAGYTATVLVDRQYSICRADHGALSESQVILECLEERYPEKPMCPSDPFARATRRELIQQLELNAKWVARRQYKKAFFGASVSEEAKREAQEGCAKSFPFRECSYLNREVANSRKVINGACSCRLKGAASE